MNTHVGRLIFARCTVGFAVLSLAATLGSVSAWAQSDAAPVAGPDARRNELRMVVRQPQQGATAAVNAAGPRHLSAEERSQLRRQLTRELRAQNAAVSVSTRP